MTSTDKIKGLIFGQAIGDALGLASEFMTKQEVRYNYPNGICSYDDMIQDRHRSIWKRGDWTDDTDQMLCILDSIQECKTVDLSDIANRFVQWKNANGKGIGRHTLQVLSIRGYAENPFKASELVWNISKKQSAANGGIMRTAILGCWDYSDWETMRKNTEYVCRLTHFDPRCVGSCVIISYIVHRCLQKQDVSKTELLNIASKYDSRIAEYVEIAYQDSVDNLKLDEPGKTGYSLKTMSAALWAYHNSSEFYSGLRSVIEQGGDADTNGAVTGALLGVKFGYSLLPNVLVDNLTRKEYLMKKVNRFIICSRWVK